MRRINTSVPLTSPIRPTLMAMLSYQGAVSLSASSTLPDWLAGDLDLLQ